MRDIVARLRDPGREEHYEMMLYPLAADEIERLRAELAELRDKTAAFAAAKEK